jgi:hypothetical protein
MRRREHPPDTPSPAEAGLLPLAFVALAASTSGPPAQFPGRAEGDEVTKPAVVDHALELRRRKQAATTKKLVERGPQAFRIIRSGEAALISYEGVSDADLPRPAV